MLKSKIFLLFLGLFFLGVFLLPSLVNGQSCLLNQHYAYKSPGSPAVYFITDACTKRAFTRSHIFFTYFSSWDDVVFASAQALRSVPNDQLGFMPYGPLYDPQYGALVKTVDDPKVYFLLGGKKYWIASETVFNALGYQWHWVEDVDARLLEKYGLGSEITESTKHPDFTLVKYAGDSRVYRLEPSAAGQVKRHIVDEAAFRALGFRYDRIVTLSSKEIYADGLPLSEADIRPAVPSKPALEAKTACDSNPNPVFTHVLVEPDTVVNILPPPNIHKASGHLKTHSYVNTTRVGIPIYAPADMELFSGAHYVGGPYSLDFRVSCEVRLRLAHIDPVQKIKDALPKEAKTDSKDVAVNPPIKFQAGELVAYVYQDEEVLSVGLDFGVYHSQKPNRYATSADPAVRQSSIYTTAVCPYDYFISAVAVQYREKFNLLMHEGMQADGSSFCS